MPISKQSEPTEGRPLWHDLSWGPKGYCLIDKPFSSETSAWTDSTLKRTVNELRGCWQPVLHMIQCFDFLNCFGKGSGIIVWEDNQVKPYSDVGWEQSHQFCLVGCCNFLLQSPGFSPWPSSAQSKHCQNHLPFYCSKCITPLFKSLFWLPHGDYVECKLSAVGAVCAWRCGTRHCVCNIKHQPLSIMALYW